jgi:hypothetical protein
MSGGALSNKAICRAVRLSRFSPGNTAFLWEAAQSVPTLERLVTAWKYIFYVHTKPRSVLQKPREHWPFEVDILRTIRRYGNPG